ncbi:MAG: hypothetical protein KGI33_12310 [Thaumarchaeota archaeon]|nr:hypothetical protein [Nitrososphaerota archaeon]
MDINKLSSGERVLLNVCIIGGITFFSTLNVAYPPTIANIYAAFIGMIIAGLTQFSTLTVPELNDEHKPRPPSASALGMLF